ncbi:MAG TPA: DUF4845 domain-containing protein [Candidatus Angelobacter sp.]|nr:DUF4845 domain-containing protein [Candidatus Angelobacter sp.]
MAWNLIPPYFHNYQLQDDLDDVARRNTYLATSEDEIKKIVIAKADNNSIKLKEDQITITRTGNGLAISVKYHIHVDMILYPVDLDFAANSMNKRI